MTRLLAALLLLCAAMLVRADHPAHPHRPPLPSFEDLALALDLSEAQREPVRSLLNSQREKLHSLDSNTQTQREDLRAAHRSELSKLLSADQLKQFDRMTSRRPPHGPSARRTGSPETGAGHGQPSGSQHGRD